MVKRKGKLIQMMSAKFLDFFPDYPKMSESIFSQTLTAISVVNVVFFLMKKLKTAYVVYNVFYINKRHIRENQ